MRRVLSFFRWAFEAHPFVTQACFTSTFVTTGDTVAQICFEKGEFRLLRTARMAFWGAFIFAPIQNRWQLFANKFVHFRSRAATVLSRVFVEQMVIGPSVVAAFFMSMGLMENNSIRRAQSRVQLKWWDTQTRGWVVWLPTSLINFMFIPHAYRLLFIGHVSLWWNVYLSYVSFSEICSIPVVPALDAQFYL